MPKRITRPKLNHGANATQLITLQAKVAQMEEGLALNRQLLAGLQECLDVATQMNAALLLRLGGSVVLTSADYKASMGQHIQREDVGDDIRLSVASAPSTQPSLALVQ